MSELKLRGGVQLAVSLEAEEPVAKYVTDNQKEPFVKNWKFCLDSNNSTWYVGSAKPAAVLCCRLLHLLQLRHNSPLHLTRPPPL
jgi:hypothetical protein